MKKFYRESETTKEEVLELLEAAKEKDLFFASIALDYFNKGDLTTVWQALRGYADGIEWRLRVKIEREGIAIDWHPNGKLRVSCNYKKGELDGKYEYFYPDGKLATSCNYKNDKHHGKWEEWYSDCKLLASRNHKDGKLDGKNEWYYPNGNLEISCNYKDDKLDGELERWNEDGELIRHELYDMGKLVKDYLKGNDHE